MSLNCRIVILHAVTALCILAMAGTPFSGARADDEARVLRQRLEALLAAPEATLNGDRVAAVPFLLRFYERRGFTPAWNDPARADELIEVIQSISDEGLSPADYHLSRLQAMRAQAAARVDLDILLTDALVTLGAHLRFGRVDPMRLDPNWNIARELQNDPVTVAQAAIDSKSLRAFIDERIPRQDFYLRFKQALADYRAIETAGGWLQVPPGRSIKPDMQDDRVPVIRDRLAAEGYLAAGENGVNSNYDGALVAAVIRFQERHGLDADGVVGKKTLAAMNVPVGARVDQLKANLERARWLFADLSGDFVLVNIAGYQAHVVRNGEQIWTTDVMVGRAYRHTPVFKSVIRYLVLNPTWTVPPTIMREDVIPAIQKDPQYLAKKGYQLLTRDGELVSLDRVDMTDVRYGNFPYIVRQPAGPGNALGRIKFMFPNEHFVFLHDTNQPGLFARRERAFTSGCIRVKEPLKLAELLLADPGKWSQEGIEQALAPGKTRIVHLDTPMPILLMYWTAQVAENGEVTFFNDIYERDARVVEALRVPLSLASLGLGR